MLQISQFGLAIGLGLYCWKKQQKPVTSTMVNTIVVPQEVRTATHLEMTSASSSDQPTDDVEMKPNYSETRAPDDEEKI